MPKFNPERLEFQTGSWVIILIRHNSMIGIFISETRFHNFFKYKTFNPVYEYVCLHPFAPKLEIADAMWCGLKARIVQIGSLIFL